ncbi:MAG: MobF family relaxase, partial [Geoalkalibacter sp.]|uniref:MobF family relaxase n=1 Tax=Geoalkalibacter sp. TaxID=3041440 RepID=UPI003D14E8B2
MVGINGVSWGQLVDYYRRDSYYFGPAVEHAQVHGSGARRFGFDRLKLDPLTVFERLVSGRKTPAQDVCLSAPKSVSLLAVLGDEGQQNDAIEAHRIAVERSLAYIELDGFFRVQKKEFGCNHKYRAEGMLAVAINHLLSREMEPQLHTHALIMNGGVIPGEGRIRSADFKRIYDHQAHLDRVYKSHLRAALAARGYPTRTTETGFELSSVSEAQIGAFSSAKGKLDAALAIRGKGRTDSTAKERQQVNKAIRKKKKAIADEAALRRRWEERARDVELCLPQPDPTGTTLAPPDAVGSWVEQEVLAMMAEQVLVTRLELFDRVVQNLQQADVIAEPGAVSRCLDAVLAEHKAFRLPGQDVPPGDVFQERLILEQVVLSEMDRLRPDRRESEERPTKRDTVPNALKLFLAGLDKEMDDSRFAGGLSRAVERYRSGQQALAEARSELAANFRDCTKIPRKFRDELAQLRKGVDHDWRADLREAQRCQPGADRLTARDRQLLDALNQWVRKNADLDKRLKADNSQCREANHGKRRDLNDGWLANRIEKTLAMPWHPDESIRKLLRDLDEVMVLRDAGENAKSLASQGNS